MKAFTVKNTWSDHDSHGWGNGYVAIPPTSSWHGVDHWDLPISTYRNLSWSSKPSELIGRGVKVPNRISLDDWIIGFDTMGDESYFMTKLDVEFYTHKLLLDMKELGDTPYVHDDPKVIFYCPHCGCNNDVSDSFEYGRYCAVMHSTMCGSCQKTFYFSV